MIIFESGAPYLDEYFMIFLSENKKESLVVVFRAQVEPQNREYRFSEKKRGRKQSLKQN